MGTASRQNYSATLPANRFHCLLDDLPLHLAPRSSRRAVGCGDSEGSLFLSSNCVFCFDEQLPEGLDREIVSGFALGGCIAWVRQPGSGMLMPFWLSPELWDALRDWPRGGSETISQDTCTILSEAGILSPPGFQEKAESEWEGRIARSSALFQETGYAPLAGLIHPFHVAALRRYYRTLIRTGKMELGDRQSSRRYIAYNDPVARFFHQQIAMALSTVAGEPLKASYVYLASYLSGAKLKKHTDREQCEFSVTLCLDFSPEPTLETPWPIRLDTPRGTVTVYQALGDGLAYRGTRLPHYRDVLSDGRTSTSIFFHYVSADFAGPLG